MNTMEKQPSVFVRYGVADHQLSSAKRWLTFACMFFFGFTTVYSMFKASAALTDVAAVFNMTLSEAGNIAGLFGLSGMLFAFPGAWIMRNFGIKSSLILTAIITLLGSIMGLFATNTFLFLTSRVIEGFGMGMISVIGPNVMPRLFPLKRQGLVMGVWSLWVPAGSIIAFLTTPLLYGSFGWTSLWWVSIILEVISIIWLLACCKMNKVPENELVDGDVSKKRMHRKSHVASGIIIALAFTFWAFVYAGVINVFYPTFLMDAKGMSMELASMPTLVIAVVTIPFGILFGIITDRTNTRKWWLAISYILVAVLMAFVAFNESSEGVTPWVFAVLMGLAAAGVPMATRSLIPVLVPDPRKMDYTLAIMAFVTYIGQLFAGPYGAFVTSDGWHTGALFILAPCVIVAFVMVAISKSDKKALAAETGDLSAEKSGVE